MLFYPLERHAITPDFFGYEYKNIWLFLNEDVRIHGWHIKARKDKPFKGTIIFFHGNAQNISYHFYPLRWMMDEGYDFVTFDYRGFGMSTGNPRIPEVFDDMSLMLKWVNKNISGKKIILGQSIGAGLALSYFGQHSEQQKNFCAFVFDSAFYSYTVVAQEVLGSSALTFLFQYPGSWTMPSRAIDPINLVKNINAPKIFIHGRKDRVIKFYHSEKLFEKALPPKKFIKSNAGHIASLNYKEQRKSLLENLNLYCK